MKYRGKTVFNLLGRILTVLPDFFKGKAYRLVAIIFINSLFEIFGLAAILPVLATILKEDFIERNNVANWLYLKMSFESKQGFILFLSVLIVLITLFKNLFGIWVQKKQATFTWDLHKYLAVNIFKNFYLKGYAYFSSNNSNVILNRVNTVPLQFASQLLVSAFQFINEILIVILVAVSLLIYDFYILFLLMVIVLPVFFGFYHFVKNRVSRYGACLNDLGPEISKPIYEVVFGYVDVVINGVFSHFLKRYTSNIERAKGLRISVLVLKNVPNKLIESSVIMTVLVILVYGVFILNSPELIIELLTIFGLAAYRLVPSINRIMLSLVGLKNMEFTIDFIEKFYNGDLKEEEVHQVVFNKEFKIKNIKFKYSGNENYLINDFSLSIRKGASIGIVGKSGSGKTTLMNIMLCFLCPNEGELLVDGHTIKQKHISSWQNKCGYVRQDVFLVDGSLKDNIAFGVERNDVDLSRLYEVIEKSSLMEMVNSLSEGINTEIGERGAKISGGQRQRIGIARALYHGAEILFFDEATSALDTQTEEEITEAIRTLQKDKLTVIIIAHRESTLKYCDHVVQLSE